MGRPTRKVLGRDDDSDTGESQRGSCTGIDGFVLKVLVDALVYRIGSGGHCWKSLCVCVMGALIGSLLRPICVLVPFIRVE
jgi:hypothetical protein